MLLNLNLPPLLSPPVFVSTVPKMLEWISRRGTYVKPKKEGPAGGIIHTPGGLNPSMLARRLWYS